MRKAEWTAAIDKELTKFEKNLCLQIVPYNGQHQVPMMDTQYQDRRHQESSIGRSGRFNDT